MGLKRHNVYREKHFTPILTLDNKLNKIAQSYAEYLAKHALFQHSNISGLGENLYQSCTTATPYSKSNYKKIILFSLIYIFILFK